MSRPECIPATWRDQGGAERAAFRHCWTYRPAPDADPLGFVVRYERTDGGKIVVPFFRHNGTPGQFKAGTVLNGIFSHQDWMATLLAAAGEKEGCHAISSAYSARSSISSAAGGRRGTRAQGRE